MKTYKHKNLPNLLTQNEIPENVIDEIGAQIKYYVEEIKMRWCKLESMYGVTESVLRRVLSLYNERVQENKVKEC